MNWRRALGALVLGHLLGQAAVYALVQRGNLGLLRHGRTPGAEVALTFDDGPDPATTPAVLRALEAAGVRATFFVNTAQARAHPDLVREMLAAGHDVGSHGERHRHGWLFPFAVPLDTARAARTLRELTGEPPRWHRPPHGAYTALHLPTLRALRLTGVHWTVEAGDWRPGAVPQELSERLRAELRPGGIVVLHDAGPGGVLTAQALPGLLADLLAEGYRPVALRELPGLRSERARDLPGRLLSRLDRAYDRAAGTRPVGRGAERLLRLSVSKLPASVSTPQGDYAAGTPVLELHIDSGRMAELLTGGKLRTARTIATALKEAERAAREDPQWSRYPLMFSVGTFEQFLARLGFSAHDLPPAMTRRLALWSRTLRWINGVPIGEREPPLRLSVRVLDKDS